VTASRTYTRGELSRMKPDQLAGIADDLLAAVRDGRIVDDPPPVPTGDGPVFTRSQLAAMPQAALIGRHDEIRQALADNRVQFDQ
jgi:hypothetical protein